MTLIYPDMTAAPPIVHHPAYDAKDVPDEHRFPMRKFSALADLLREEGLVGEQGFVKPIIAPFDWVTLAHSPDYVARVFDACVPRQEARRIGFDITEGVARRARAAVAGTCLTARLALEHGVACNPAGGSHHASYETGAGYCVFNDVAVAAKLMQEEGLAARILVIDFDVHQGDGTARIFADDPSVFTLSVHCEKNWPTRKAHSDLDVGLEPDTTDGAYLEIAARAVRDALEASKPDLVFYNAGVDPHRDDRLGKLSLSDQGISKRDQQVFDAARDFGAPIAGVLGGGYQNDVRRLAGLHAHLHRAASRALIAA